MVQICGTAKHHIALVISPLRSLIQDQLERLKAMGVVVARTGAKEDMTEEDYLGVFKCTLGWFNIACKIINATFQSVLEIKILGHYILLGYHEMKFGISSQIFVSRICHRNLSQIT
jgi:hypothetical protein